MPGRTKRPRNQVNTSQMTTHSTVSGQKCSHSRVDMVLLPPRSGGTPQPGAALNRRHVPLQQTTYLVLFSLWCRSSPTEHANFLTVTDHCGIWISTVAISKTILLHHTIYQTCHFIIHSWTVQYYLVLLFGHLNLP